MCFLKEERAQGNLEVIMLIAGALLLVSIVGVILKRAATNAAQRAGDTINQTPP